MKHLFNVIINDPVAEEIQEEVDFYKQKQTSLGTRFYKASKSTLKSLEKDALLYQIKYDNVRCVRVKNFPYLIHYTVNQKTKTVRVFSIISTHKDPDGNWVK